MSKNSKLIAAIAVVIVVIIVVVIVIVAGNHKSKAGSVSSLTSSQKAADVQQIKSNWESLFSASTPLSQREQLLQNGTKFGQPIQSEFASLSSAKSSATVSSVNLTTTTSANVEFSVDLNNQPVLTNQKGTALKVNNNWVVSDSTLCGLLSMDGSKPTACQGY